MSKKDFKNNPALQFITAIDKENETEKKEEEKNIDNNTINTVYESKEDTKHPTKPLYIETKSKRFNMLMQPSVHKELKKIAIRKKISINELINQILKEYIEVK